MQKLLLLILLSSSFIAHAQTPQAINYQAVARTSSGAALAAQPINVRFSILQGSVSGTLLFQETHQTTTNSLGLFTLAIGRGTAASGVFGTINWSAGGDKYLKVEVAADGTTNYQVQGTAQLLSVPYALYAEKTNLVAGNGININGNIISSVAGNQWQSHTNGIYYSAGRVGIGMTPHEAVPLSVYLPNTGVGSAVLHLKSNDTWHTAMSMFNGDPNASPPHYSLILTGPSNSTALTNTFGIFNHQSSTWGLSFHPTSNHMAVGSTSAFYTNAAKSRLHVFAGDVNIDQIGSGIIMKSPNGNCWRITIDDSGNLVRTAITCP